MKQVIAVCGQIGSGKSAVIRELQKRFGWDTVSFGDYVKSRIPEENPSRETYQDLGQTLFVSRGPRGLVKDAIRFSNPLTDTFLIDGVRHVAIVTELRLMYGDPIVIFLDVVDPIRHERFSRRNKHQPVMSYEDFMTMCQHPIEQGIPKIANIADVVIDANRAFDTVLAEIVRNLSQRHSALTDSTV